MPVPALKILYSLDFAATSLPVWGGAQLAIDTTLVAPLTSNGQPRRRRGAFQGAALHDARLRKSRAYPELLRFNRCHLVVLALEVGGRWSIEAAEFVRLLAAAKTRSVVFQHPSNKRLPPSCSAASRPSLMQPCPHLLVCSLALGLELRPTCLLSLRLATFLLTPLSPPSSPVPLAFQASRLPCGLRELQKATKGRELCRSSSHVQKFASQTSASGKKHDITCP